jgi:hypothetical protein
MPKDAMTREKRYRIFAGTKFCASILAESPDDAIQAYVEALNRNFAAAGDRNRVQTSDYTAVGVL